MSQRVLSPQSETCHHSAPPPPPPPPPPSAPAVAPYGWKAYTHIKERREENRSHRVRGEVGTYEL